MSRWTDNFESHGVNLQWQRVADAIALTKPEDPEVLPHVVELARLKKVAAYVDQALRGVDPELLPLNFWDAIRDQLSACADQLNAFNTNKSLEHLHNANGNFDSVLTKLRPYLLAKGRLGPALQTAAKAYSSALSEAASELKVEVDKAVADVRVSAESVSKLLGEAKTSSDEINRRYDELVVDSDEEATFTVLNRQIEEINAFYRRFALGADESPSIKEEMAAAREAAITAKDAIEKLRSGVQLTTENLEKFEARILGAPAEGGKREGGLSEDLNSRLTTLGNVEDQQKKRYKALNDQIESLLPGATSAGLATAYKQMRDSFSKPIKNANRMFFWSIISLLFLSVLVNVEDFGLWRVEFIKLTDWASVGRSLAHKLPFYAPLVWLAYYASKRRSEFQRLEQEYAHKEALAKSYDSYKKQITELGGDSDQLMRDLLVKAVDAIAFNASTSLDGKHGDKIPLHEALEKAVAAGLRQQVKT